MAFLKILRIKTQTDPKAGAIRPFKTTFFKITLNRTYTLGTP
jgi:hypothetical protein